MKDWVRRLSWSFPIYEAYDGMNKTYLLVNALYQGYIFLWNDNENIGHCERLSWNVVTNLIYKWHHWESIDPRKEKGNNNKQVNRVALAEDVTGLIVLLRTLSDYIVADCILDKNLGIARLLNMQGIVLVWSNLKCGYVYLLVQLWVLVNTKSKLSILWKGWVCWYSRDGYITLLLSLFSREHTLIWWYF